MALASPETALDSIAVPDALSFSALRSHALVVVVSRDGSKTAQALLDVRKFISDDKIEMIDAASMAPCNAQQLCFMAGRSTKTDPERKILAAVKVGADGSTKWKSLHRIKREIAASSSGAGGIPDTPRTPRVSSFTSLVSAGNASTTSLVSLMGEEDVDEEEALKIAMAEGWAANMREANNLAGAGFSDSESLCSDEEGTTPSGSLSA